ncbi:uncharacterized protein JCM15063_001570 [Sporobolomyces koalae]|uniref:uncharacterized protein n=1 Tax=Sporobolomyces koalae TaxID=500713 RepID=UPI00316BDB98
MVESPARTRRSKPVPTNSLILVLPQLLFSPSLLPLFELHFGRYGQMVSWTPLERLGRVLVVYDEVDDAANAKEEMDGFVWEDSEPGSSTTKSEPPEALRVFFGPSIPLPIPTSLSSTLLAVPSTGRNFLISPPGSPPVGWEQLEEDAPNKQVWHESDEPEPVDLGQTFSPHWADELVRALRFLSVDSDGPADSDADHIQLSDTAPTDDLHSFSSKTQVILAPSTDSPRPAVVVSTPPISTPPSHNGTPPPGAARISSVKATIESMLVKKRSSSDLRGSATASAPRTPGSSNTMLGGDSIGPARITPTARPPIAPEL